MLEKERKKERKKTGRAGTAVPIYRRYEVVLPVVHQAPAGTHWNLWLFAPRRFHHVAPVLLPVAPIRNLHWTQLPPEVTNCAAAVCLVLDI